MRRYSLIRTLLMTWPISLAIMTTPLGMGSAETMTYTYDANGQLIKVDYGDAKSTVYTYDGAGNILTRVTTGGTAQYTLTVSKSGDGSGTVTSNPAGINCGADCDQAYDPHTGVSLAAIPSPGSTFAGWSGACSGTGNCSVTMDGDKAVVATFQQQSSQSYSLTIAKAGTGDGMVTSSPSGITCGSDCSETYSKVTKVKLTAKADTNSIFSGWSGAGCFGTKTCSVNVNGDLAVTASFAATIPDISIAQTAVDFGIVAVGKKKTVTIKIDNVGAGDLIVALEGLSGTDFSFSGNSGFTIKPKKNYSLKLTFAPASSGTKTAGLKVNSNDLDTPVKEISLTGTDGQSPPLPPPPPSEIIFRPGPGKNDGSDNGSQNAGKDTSAAGGDPAKNYGAESYITGTPKSNCNPAETKAYIQFDLSSLPANVSQVFLGVTHITHTNCYDNCNADFYFYLVTQAWNEMTVTFNNRPTEGGAVYGPLNIKAPNDLKTREYDITSIYKNWKNGSVPNYGLAIYSPTVGCNNAAAMFYVHSSDDPDPNVRPYLRIVP